MALNEQHAESTRNDDEAIQTFRIVIELRGNRTLASELSHTLSTMLASVSPSPAVPAAPTHLVECAGQPASKEPSQATETMTQWIERVRTYMRAESLSASQISNVIAAMRDGASSQGWTMPANVDARTMIEHMNAMEERGCGPKTRRDWRACIGKALKIAIGKAAAEVVLDKVPIPKTKKRRARLVPTLEQVQRLIVAARSDWRKGDRWLWYLIAATTGLRASVVSALDWAWFSYSSDGPACFEIPAEHMKRGEHHRVWLTREVATLLNEYQEAQGSPTNGQILQTGCDNENFDRDLRKAGIAKRHEAKGATMARNSLRHFAATYLSYASSFSDRERADVMHHSTPRMTTGIYTDRAATDFGRKIWSLQSVLPYDIMSDFLRREVCPVRALRVG